MAHSSSKNQLTVSCIIPARNEAGHLEEVLNNVMSVDAIHEVLIVEGGSTDNTWQVALKLKEEHGDKVLALQQTGRGKFNAVMEASRLSKGKFILIWDADGTISLQDSERIIYASTSSGESATGNRLLGKMEKHSMRFANYLGNWAFAILWVPILRSRPIDLLCGTKIFPRIVFDTLPEDLEKLDPYGDFSLLANARRLEIPIKSIKVDYFARTYGQTNIHRWSGGLRLLFLTIQIARKMVKGS